MTTPRTRIILGAGRPNLLTLAQARMELEEDGVDGGWAEVTGASYSAAHLDSSTYAVYSVAEGSCLLLRDTYGVAYTMGLATRPAVTVGQQYDALAHMIVSGSIDDPEGDEVSTVALVWKDGSGTTISSTPLIGTFSDYATSTYTARRERRWSVTGATAPTGAVTVDLQVSVGSAFYGYWSGALIAETHPAGPAVWGNHEAAYLDVTDRWDAGRPFTVTRGRASDTDTSTPPARLSGLVLNNDDGALTIGGSGSLLEALRVPIVIQASLYTAPEFKMFRHTLFRGVIDAAPLAWRDSGLTCEATISAQDRTAGLGRLPLPARDLLLVQYAGQLSTRLCGYWPLTADTSSQSGFTSEMPPGGPFGNTGRPLTGVSAPSKWVDWLGVDTSPVLGIEAGQSWEAGPPSSPYSSDYWWEAGGFFQLTPDTRTGDVLTVHLGDGGRQVGVGWKDTTTLALFTVDTAGTRTWDASGMGAPSTTVWYLIRLQADTSYLRNTCTAMTDFGSSTQPWQDSSQDWWLAYSRSRNWARTTAEQLRDGAPGRRNLRISDGAEAAARVYYAESPAGPLASSWSSWPHPYGLTSSGYWYDTWLSGVLSVLTGSDVTVGTGYTSGYTIWLHRAMPSTVAGLAADYETHAHGMWLDTFLPEKQGMLLSYTHGRIKSYQPEWEVSATQIEDMRTAADAAAVVNQVTATALPPTGNPTPAPAVTLTESNAASVTANGPQTQTRTLAMLWEAEWTPTPSQLAMALQRNINHVMHLNPTMRITGLVVDALTQDDDLDRENLLRCAPWQQRIHISGLPTSGGWDSNYAAVVEGFTLTFGVSVWRYTFNTRPAGIILNDSQFSTLDTNARIG